MFFPQNSQSGLQSRNTCRMPFDNRACWIISFPFASQVEIVCQWNKSEAIQFVRADHLNLPRLENTFDSGHNKSRANNGKIPHNQTSKLNPPTHQRPTASLLSLRSLPSKCSLPTPRITPCTYQWQLTFVQPAIHHLHLSPWQPIFIAWIRPNFGQAKPYYYQLIKDLINGEV